MIRHWILLLLLASGAGAYTLDAEHPLYSYAEGIYVFDNRADDGDNIAGTGTMVGTVEDADGFDTPITQTFQSWYNSFGSAYTICLWHTGWTLGTWNPVFVINSAEDSNVINWCRNSTNTYLRVYHNNVNYDVTELATSEIAGAMMLSFVWNGTNAYGYDGNDVIATKAAATAPQTNCTTATIALGGTATVTRLYIFSKALDADELGALEADPNSIFAGEAPAKADDPDPADDATLVSLPVTLSWDESAGATDYNVYFSKVGDSLALMGNVDANEYEPNCFSGTEYQWRIDANNASGSTEGNVWTFTTALAKVTTPDPAHNETNVSVDQILSWVESDGATDYDVYVGLIGGSLSLLGNVTDELYDPVLNYSQGYQWRIDANNASTTTTGDIWQFYTEAEPVVEPNEPEPEPAEPEEPSGWQQTRPWRRSGGWIKRVGTEGWRKR